VRSVSRTALLICAVLSILAPAGASAASFTGPKNPPYGQSAEDAETLLEWAAEYGVPHHGPEAHPERNYKLPHIHIKPVDHITIK
jgi:hypothetical protein